MHSKVKFLSLLMNIFRKKNVIHILPQANLAYALMKDDINAKKKNYCIFLSILVEKKDLIVSRKQEDCQNAESFIRLSLLVIQQ
jgi:hypothetical protein